MIRYCAVAQGLSRAGGSVVRWWMGEPYCPLTSSKRASQENENNALYHICTRVVFIVLKWLGCGAVMLGGIVAMYNVTYSILGTALSATTIGVRPGSPASCSLFFIYVNNLIKAVKENCDSGSFFLVLIDGKVVLWKRRTDMIRKLMRLRLNSRLSVVWLLTGFL